MTNESQFSRWFCKKLRDYGCFVQRIETSTGNGVPDLWVADQDRSNWIELKFNTLHIRPEQYVWAKQLQGIHDKTSLVVIGWPDGSFSVANPLTAKAKTKSYVLQKDAYFKTYQSDQIYLFLENYF